MKQVPQRILGNGHGGPYGDCFKCCVASILECEYEDVPNFCDPAVHGDTHWWEFFREWLHREHGLEALGWDHFVSEGGDWDFAPRPHETHDGYWMATVRSAVFGPHTYGDVFCATTHLVVMANDKVVYDPSPFPHHTPYEFCGEMWFEDSEHEPWESRVTP
jgi:hypothetical protein